MKNPFESTSPFNRALSIENCQRIFFSAAQSAKSRARVPQELFEDLRSLAIVYGPEVYILHPNDIEQMFHGVTLTVYQSIKALFCTPLFRNNRTISQILGRWAHEANAPPPSAEAVWAICEYLRAYRDEYFRSHIERAVTRWYIDVVEPDAVISVKANTSIKPRFVCVVSDAPEYVLAFRAYDAYNSSGETVAHVLYEAIIGQRRPEPFIPGGITWRIPSSVVSTILLPADVQVCCEALNLSIENVTSTPAIIRDLDSTWTRSLTGRTLSAERFEAIFDNYLERRHGYGPRKARDDADYANRHLDGYNRDPALIFPPLRYLLSVHQAIVRDDGIVVVNGRQYINPLLSSWCGKPVDVRISRHDPSQVYVYLNGAILCQAQEAVESPELEHTDLSSDSSI